MYAMESARSLPLYESLRCLGAGPKRTRQIRPSRKDSGALHLDPKP